MQHECPKALGEQSPVANMLDNRIIRAGEDRPAHADARYALASEPLTGRETQDSVVSRAGVDGVGDCLYFCCDSRESHGVCHGRT